MPTAYQSIKTNDLSFTCHRCKRSFTREYPGSSFQDFGGPNEMYLATVFPLGERELIDVCNDCLLESDTNDGEWEGSEDSMNPVPCVHCGKPIGNREMLNEPGETEEWECEVLNRFTRGFWASHRRCLTEDDGLLDFTDEDHTPVIITPTNALSGTGQVPPYALVEYYWIPSSPWEEDNSYPLPTTKEV